jgi:acyl-coenzyme A synthetase/AMP-(fatty) acid ligase
MGRRDRQVKIRGQRVEPAEIEDALRRVAGVADAAIVAHSNGEETSLLAVIVASIPGDETLLRRVRASIKLALPNYMQPARVMLAAQLPLLPGGKVDDRALLAIDASTPWHRRSAARGRSAARARLTSLCIPGLVVRGWLRLSAPIRRLAGD